MVGRHRTQCNGKDSTMEARTKFIDFDARPRPKTDRWCCKCQKDLKVGQAHRSVYVDDQMCAVHPEDLMARGRQNHDYGWLLLGSDCAKKVGFEWTVETPFEVGT